MVLGFKTKPLEQRANDERNKVAFKAAQLQGKKLDRQMVEEKQRRIEASSIPPRLRA